MEIYNMVWNTWTGPRKSWKQDNVGTGLSQTTSCSLLLTDHCSGLRSRSCATQSPQNHHIISQSSQYTLGNERRGKKRETRENRGYLQQNKIFLKSNINVNIREQARSLASLRTVDDYDIPFIIVSNCLNISDHLVQSNDTSSRCHVTHSRKSALVRRVDEELVFMGATSRHYHALFGVKIGECYGPD